MSRIGETGAGLNVSPGAARGSWMRRRSQAGASPRVFSFEVELPADSGGISKKSKAMVNQTRAVDKVRLIEYIGTLDRKLLEKINKALMLHYDLS